MQKPTAESPSTLLTWKGGGGQPQAPIPTLRFGSDGEYRASCCIRFCPMAAPRCLRSVLRSWQDNWKAGERGLPMCAHSEGHKCVPKVRVTCVCPHLGPAAGSPPCGHAVPLIPSCSAPLVLANGVVAPPWCPAPQLHTHH